MDEEAERLMEVPAEKVRFRHFLLAGLSLSAIVMGAIIYVNSGRRVIEADMSQTAFLAETFSGVQLKSGNMNYDVVFNQTLFDCVERAESLGDPGAVGSAKGNCFNDIYSRDAGCRELAKDLIKGTCVGLQACLLNQPYAPIPDPCMASCATADPRLLHSCKVQFSALRLLSRTCVPKWIIHDQQTDWRLYQVRDAINGIAKKCGKPIWNDPFFNS